VYTRVTQRGTRLSRIRTASRIFFVCFLGTVAFFGLTPSVWAQGQRETLPDLTVTDIRLSVDFPHVNQVVDILVTVKNVGEVTAAASRAVLRINRGINSARLVPMLAPGQQATLSFGWVVRKGKQTISLQANAFKDIAEADRANNVASRVVEFTPDLVVESIQINPAHPRPNSLASILVTVRNVGGQPTKERAALRFSEDRNVLNTLFVDPLRAGERAQISVRWRPERGEHLLRFELDALGRIEESDELNNSLSHVVDISPLPPTGANLTVRSVDVSPKQPQLGQAVTFSAVVSNDGNGVADGFEVTFELDGQLLGVARVNRLAPGQAQRVSAVWQRATLGGERLVRVKVDRAGEIVETDESDNVLAQFVEVGQASNACSQLIFLELDDAATQLLATFLGVDSETVDDVFMPQVKAAIEKDFSTINVSFSLRQPRRVHSRLRFVVETRQSILGVAPLDLNNTRKNDSGTVFLGSFVGLGRLTRTTLERIAQAVANTASHEIGHFLGLNHDTDATTAQFGGRNLMAPSNEASSFFEDAFFTADNLAYLHGVLPLTCAGS